MGYPAPVGASRLRFGSASAARRGELPRPLRSSTKDAMKPDKKARAVRVPRSKGSSSGGSAGSNAKGRRATRGALQHEPTNGFEALVTEHFDESWYRSAYPEA